MKIPKFLRPDYRFERITDLTVEQLDQLGIDHLLLDVDSTIKSYRDTELEPQVIDWFRTLTQEGKQICLVSNGLGKRIEKIASQVAVPFIASAMKPSGRGCLRAIVCHRFNPQRTAMVGDQLFTDIIAAKRAGIVAIWIQPIRPEEEHWFTRWKRPLEKLLLRS